MEIKKIGIIRTKETNKHMTIMVIDGQGGKMGKGLVEQLKKLCPEDEILAIGTNSIATAAMLKSGADAGATCNSKGT